MPRTILFTIRCTEAEREHWKQLARRCGYTGASDWIRSCIRLWEKIENEHAITLDDVAARYRDAALVDPDSLRLLADRIEQEAASNPYATVTARNGPDPEIAGDGSEDDDFRPW